MAQHIYSQYLEYSFQAEYLIAGPVVEHYYNLTVEHIHLYMTVVVQYMLTAAGLHNTAVLEDVHSFT